MSCLAPTPISATTSSDSDSISEPESQNSYQDKPKRLDKVFRCWKFCDSIQADVLGGSFQERKQKLIEHFRTRTTPDRPLCVLSITIFADLSNLIFTQPSESRAISIAIVGYVQTKSSRKHTMTNWIKSANWEPVRGGLCSNHEFLRFMDYASNATKSWFELPIFGELGLNNEGRNAARIDRKVCVI